jgi:dihydropteroate synthase/dihydroneopterin aldolase
MRVDRPLVFGVLNVTPDSFSDGGEHFGTEQAIAHGLSMHALGADVVDVGGESTRPGATRIDAADEQRRVLPVIRALHEAGVPTSVDTMYASTAREAIAAGACIVNDVSGGLADPEMLATVADLDVPFIIMHWRGHSDHMDALAVYRDVVLDVVAELRARVTAALEAGVRRDRIVIDPGLGFAKDADHNWALLNRLDELTAMGFPVMVGASRKRFLGSLLSDSDGQARSLAGRDVATSAVSALAAAAGAWAVRVHDVAGSADAVLVGRAWGRPAWNSADAPRDKILLEGIRGVGHHGVFEHERREGQEFIVDLVVHLPSRVAATSDLLADTVDYGVISQRVHELIIGDPVDLIETLAERIASAVLGLGVASVEVTVHKPQAPIPVPFIDAAIRITRP